MHGETECATGKRSLPVAALALDANWKPAQALADCACQCHPSRPIQTGCLLDAVIEIAEQATDYVPSIVPAHFDVALLVHPNQAFVGQAGGS